MADRYVKSPSDVVKVNQQVEVTVLSVDLERKRIALSMKKTPTMKGPQPADSETSTPHKQTGKQRKRTDTKPVKESQKPFNNPFADAFHKQGKK